MKSHALENTTLKSKYLIDFWEEQFYSFVYLPLEVGSLSLSTFYVIASHKKTTFHFFISCAIGQKRPFREVTQNGYILIHGLDAERILDIIS